MSSTQFSVSNLLRRDQLLNHQLDENADGPSRGSALKATIKCFKCQGLGHIASDCPNSRVVIIIREELEEEIKWDTQKSKQEDEEITYEDQGESLVIQRSLNTMKWNLWLFSEV